MRHGKKFNHLSRTSSHRKAMLSNMASSLILKKRIKTTVAKAKALRQYVEPLLTKAKNDTTHSRRVVFSYLQNKYSVQELFGDVASRIADRPGGYTRIMKTGNRLGDNAEMCIIELVDYNDNLLKTEKQAKTKTRRGRSKKKSDDTPAESTPVASAETVEEAPVEDAVAETVEEVAEEPVVEAAQEQEPAETEASAETAQEEAPEAAMNTEAESSAEETPAESSDEEKKEENNDEEEEKNKDN